MITYLLEKEFSGKFKFIDSFINRNNSFIVSIHEIRKEFCKNNNINYYDLFFSDNPKIKIINKQIEKKFNQIFNEIPIHLKQGKNIYIDHEKFLSYKEISLTNEIFKIKAEEEIIFFKKEQNYNFLNDNDENISKFNSYLLSNINNNDDDKVQDHTTFIIKEFDLYFLDKVLNNINPLFKSSSHHLKNRFINLITKDILFHKSASVFSIKYNIFSDNNSSFDQFLDNVTNIYSNKIKNFINIYYKDHLLFKNYSNLNTNDNYYFNIMDFKLKKLDLSEQLFDNYYKIKEHSNVLRFSKSFLKSYKGLLNDISFELFRELYKKELPREEISTGLRKISAYNSSDDLINSLNKILEKNKINQDFILNKCKEEKLLINQVYNENNILVLRIDDFKSSKSLGSSQWCISYDEDTFYSYLENDYFENQKNHGSHYFVWDFNRPYHDPLRQIGITLDFGQNVIASHDINDKNISVSNIFDPDFINILKDDYVNNIFDISADFSSTDYGTLLSDSTEYSDRVPYPLYILENSTNTDNLILDTTENYFNINKYIVKKTISDHFKYHLISHKQVFNSIKSFSETIDELIKNNNQETFFCDYNNKFDVFNSDFFVFFNQIPELDKLDILSENNNIFSLIFANSFNLYSTTKKVIDKETINFYFNNDFILSNFEKSILFIQYSNKFNDDNINNKIIPFFENYLKINNDLPLILLKSKNDKMLNLFVDHVNKNDFFNNKEIKLKSFEIQIIKDKLFNNLSSKNQKKFLNLINQNKKTPKKTI